MHGPRFDRIVPLITLVLLGFGVVFLLELNTELLVINLGEGLPSFSVAWALIAGLALVTGIGVELVARAEPELFASGWTTQLQVRGRQLDLALPLWSLPMLTPVAVFAFFRLFRGVLATNAYLLVLMATFALLMLVLTAQHYLIGGTPAGRATARTVLTVIAYILAFAIFSAVAFTRNQYRTLYALMLVFPSTLLLAADLLRGHVHALWPTAVTIAVVMVEGYWAINFWPVSFWLVSVGLLVIFYCAVGLAQAANDPAQAQRGADRGLTRHAVVEYGVVGMGAFVALVIAAVVLQAQNIELRAP